MPKHITIEDLIAEIGACKSAKRLFVAIAGAPGSGKSTLADDLVHRLNAEKAGSAALLPMDGYHYDDRILIERGLRPRKGAPETFDVGGLLHMLDRLKKNTETEIAVPVFDRDLEISRAGARMISNDAEVIVIEGNYLLLNAGPWSQLKALFDLSVMIDVPESVLRDRLIARWQSYNIAPAEIEAKVEGNDLPNGRFVIANSVAADVRLSAS
jgi:pantothenate kinase